MNYIANGYVRSGYIREDSDTVGSYTFDKYGKKIFVSEAVSSIDLADMWSRFVDWYVVGENTKIKPAMKYSGFDVIPTGFTGATFFMYNGWKCVYNPNTTAVSGVLYSEDYPTGYWDINDNPIYPVTVSAVVNTVSVGSGLSVAQNEKLMGLLNADFTATDLAIAGVKADTETIIDDVSAISVDSRTTADTVGAAFKRLERIEAFVWVDTELLENGDGTQDKPFNNVNDAKNLVEATGINNIKLSGDIIVTHNLKNMNIFGIDLPKINLNSQDIKGTQFTNVQLEGACTGNMIAQECILLDGLRLNGYYNNCALNGHLSCLNSSFILMSSCYSNIPGTSRPTISMNSGTSSKLGVRNYSGGLTIKDSDHIDDTCTIEIAQGSLTFDSSCTAGTMIARGACKFLDETNGATVIDETILYDANVDLSEVNTKLDNITNNLGLTAEQHNQLMQLVNYDDKQLKNLAYVILGA